MKNNTLFKRSVAVGLAGVLALGCFNGIGAYFTSTSSASDTYTIGKVEIELSGSDNDFAKINLMPLQEYDYTRKVTNTGLNDAFVFMTVSIPYIETETVNKLDGTISEQTDYTQVLTYGVKGDKDAAKAGVNSQFKLVGDGRVGDITIDSIAADDIKGASELVGAVDKTNKCITYVYAYADEGGNLTALAPQADTGYLFDTLKVANLADAANMKAAGNIKINAYAIQTKNILEPSAFTGLNNDGSTDMTAVWTVVQNACSVESTQAAVQSVELTNENDGAQQSMINIAGVDYKVLAVEDGKAFLMQDKVDANWNKDYDTPFSETSSHYNGSNLDTYLEGTLYEQLKEELGENAIAETVLTSDSLGDEQSALTRHVYALSLDEALNTDYGFADNWDNGYALEDDARVALDENEEPACWWLRSASGVRNVYSVKGNGSVSNGANYFNDSLRARAAFQLNLDAVVLTGSDHSYTAIAK